MSGETPRLSGRAATLALVGVALALGLHAATDLVGFLLARAQM